MLQQEITVPVLIIFKLATIDNLKYGCMLIVNRLAGFHPDQDQALLVVSPDSSTVFFTIKLFYMNNKLIFG